MGAVWENPAAAAVPGKYRWCLNMAGQYKRILLKVSGEALSGEKGTGFDEATIASICAGIKAAYDLGAQIGIVVGGGNFWRGRSSGKMDRMDADKIGMLATVMNAIAVKDALRCERAMREFLQTKHSDLIARIEEQKVLSKEDGEALKAAIEDFQKNGAY